MFLKRILKAILFKNPVKLPFSYCVLVILRFVFTILPQQGYIHPDEFFQNLEVVAGDILSVEVVRTWEFDPTFPIRNIFVPKMILGPPLHFIRIANPYIKYYFNIDLRTPYYLLVIPRVFICFLSLINDYCLYRICVLYDKNFRNRLKIFASSYVVLVYCCRSFSNSFEMIFLSVLLLLVAECMLKSDEIIYHDEFLGEKYRQETALERVGLFQLKTDLPEHALTYVIVISSIVVIGIFNSPTFFVLVFCPISFWLHRGLGSKVIGFKDFYYRIFMFIICSVPTALLLIIIDSVYYEYLTMVEIESWCNWVVTPLNFLRHNLDTGNISNHGVHPRWLHLAVNIPLLFNTLGILAIITLIVNTYRYIRGQYSKLPRLQSITRLMLLSLVVPIAVLSLFPYQKPRFIIPVLVPLVYLYGNQLHANASDGANKRRLRKCLLYFWYIANILLCLLYGFIHQRGIYPLAKTLYQEINSKNGVHTQVITTHSYTIPKYLLQLESTRKVVKDEETGQIVRIARSIFIDDYGSLPMKELFVRVNDVLTGAEIMLHKHKNEYRFYIASPCSLEEELLNAAMKYSKFSLIEDYSFYPHFSSEAFPKFPHHHDQLCVDNNLRRNQSIVVDLNVLQRISCFVKRFCIKIYRVEAMDTKFN